MLSDKSGDNSKEVTPVPISNTEVNDLTAIYDCVVGQMQRNSICETNGKFRLRKLLNVEGTNTFRIGRLENSQTNQNHSKE